MCYDCVVRYADEDASTFHGFKLPANPFLPPQNEVIHDNERFVIDKMNWTEVIQDTNNPEVNDMEPSVDITEEGINSMKDSSNGTIRFMGVMRWCLPRFDDGETDLFTW